MVAHPSTLTPKRALVKRARRSLFTVIIFLSGTAAFAQTSVNGDITTNTTWTSAGSPYSIDLFGGINVDAGVTLTIEPGVTVIFSNSNNDLTVNGTLIADGEPGDSIYFQQSLANIFLSNSSTGSIIDHCRFDDGGTSNVAALHVSNDATITNSRFVNCEVGVTAAAGASPSIQDSEMLLSNDYGIRVDNGSPLINNVLIDGGGGGIWLQNGSPTITNSTIQNVGTNGGIWIDHTVAPTIDNNTFINNGRDIRTHPLLLDDTFYDNNGLSVVHVDPINITANTTWHKPQSPEDWYYELIFGNITVETGNTLTIEPGVEVVFTNNSQNLFIDGTLTAVGTPDDSIYFRDNFATVELRAGSGASMLDYFSMEGMGFANVSGLVISSDATISNSYFKNNEIGFSVQNGASPTITNVWIDNSTDYGVWVEDGSPSITNSAITNNSFGGVHNNGGGLVTATNIWWGDASGPTNDSNPTGTGDIITGNVNFDPFLVNNPFLPIAPSNLFVTEVSSTRLDLSWDDNSLNETDFAIERSDGNNTNFVVVGTSEADAPDFVDNSLTVDNGYFYRVRAFNTLGSSGYTNEKFGSTIAQPGNALQFDGTDDEVNLGDQLPIDNIVELSFEAWINVPDFATQRTIFSEHASSLLRNEVEIRTNGTIAVHIGMYSEITDDPILVDTWTHVAFVFDGNNSGADQLIIYINGIEVATGTSNPEPGMTSATGVDAVIGARAGLGLNFSGRMDELRLWNVARTRAEIQSNLDNQLNGDEPGLIAYYRFDQDEPTDLLLPDRSTNNYNGTWSGAGADVTTPQWVASGALDGSVIPNNTLDFDGSNYVEFPNDDPTFDPGAGFTLEAWINPTNLNNSVQHIAGINNDYRILIDAANQFQLGTSDGAGISNVTDPVSALTQGVWTHVAATFESGTARLFIDGREVYSEGGVFTPQNLSIPFYVGGIATGSFFGQIDEVRLWDFAKTEAEIVSVIATPLTGNETGLIAYYSFNQGNAGGDNSSITTLFDFTDSGINGTLNNFALTGGASNWITSGSMDVEPEIKVYLGAGTSGPELFNNQVIPANFGNVPASTTGVLTFTIENDGLADLSVDLVSVDGGFSIPSFSPFTIPARSTSSFTVELTASSSGISNGFLTIDTDDADESMFRMPVTGTRGTLDPKVYWTDEVGTQDDEIGRSNLDGSDLQAAYYDGFSIDIRGIAIDTVNNMVFWTNTDDGTIRCGRIGDAMFEATGRILDRYEGTSGVVEYLGLDVDGTAGHVYWADKHNGHIRRVDFDGSNVTDLASIVDPRDVALDIAGGKMYYVANPGAPQVWRANLDGSSEEMIYSSGSTLFTGIALDLVNNHVYWTESVGGVSRSDLDGSNQTFVTSQVSNPGGIDLDPANQMMYIADDNQVVRISYADDPVEVIQTSAVINSVQDLAIDPRVYPSFTGGVFTQDYNALVDLYNSTTGASWTINTNWLSGDVNTWHGVTVVGDRVTELQLNANNLDGTIPTSIGDLTQLTDFEATDNLLSGSIPTTISTLTSLQNLFIQNNLLTGSIPTQVGDLTSLVEFKAYNNQLSGSIPSEIGNLLNLVDVELRQNQLTGSIPPELGDCVSLQELELQRNMLTGTIPPDLGDLTNLTELHMEENQLFGTIPTEIGNLSNLVRFRIYDNLLIGAVPTSFQNLVNLTVLEINDNQLTDLPDLTALTLLTSLDVSNNNFEFDDLEPNVGIGGIVYSPQATISTDGVNLDEGDELNISIPVGGTSNQYQWVKDGTDLTDQTTDNLLIASVVLTDAGMYHLEVTNPVVTGLTISSEAFAVSVASGNSPPTISYTFYVWENTEAGTLIGSLAGDDPDGDALSYSIVSGNTDNAFSINASSGEISVNSKEALDFETTPVFSLVVQADDGNGGVTMLDITINLLDIVTGIDDELQQIAVYPNPVEGVFFIDLGNLKDVQLSMHSINGAEVLIESLITNRTGELIGINTSTLESGLYMLRLQVGNDEVTKNIYVK